MGIRISYSVGADDETFVPCESFQEAKRRHAAGDSIWLVINDERVLELPPTYNRCVATAGQKINTGVLRLRELHNEHNSLPLPDEAPMLIFDFDHGRVDWLPEGIGHRVVTLHKEVEG